MVRIHLVGDFIYSVNSSVEKMKKIWKKRSVISPFFKKTLQAKFGQTFARENGQRACLLSDDPSSNPAEVYNTLIILKNENKQKKMPRIDPFKKHLLEGQ